MDKQFGVIKQELNKKNIDSLEKYDELIDKYQKEIRESFKGRLFDEVLNELMEN